MAKKPVLLIPKLGMKARDRITGFEGIIIGYTVVLNNCDRWVLLPPMLESGVAPDAHSADEPNLELLEETKHKVIPPHPYPAVSVGDIVRDTASGAEGTLYTITTWSNGCVRGTLQIRKLGKDGLPVKPVHLDLKDVVLVKSMEPRAEKVATGGPHDAPRQR